MFVALILNLNWWNISRSLYSLGHAWVQEVIQLTALLSGSSARSSLFQSLWWHVRLFVVALHSRFAPRCLLLVALFCRIELLLVSGCANSFRHILSRASSAKIGLSVEVSDLFHWLGATCVFASLSVLARLALEVFLCCLFIGATDVLLV